MRVPKLISPLLVSLLLALVACGGEPVSEDSAETPSSSIDTVSENELPADAVRLYVGPERLDCVGVAPQKCYLVKRQLEDDWTYFYDEIHGFDHVDGFAYELIVEEQAIDDPPADASALRYVLIEVVSKHPAATESHSLPRVENLIDRLWQLQTMGVVGNEEPLIEGSSITLELTRDGRIRGSAGCNRFFAEYKVTQTDSVAYGPLGITRMTCEPEEIMEQERAFLAALHTISGDELNEDELRLLYDEDTKALTFREIPEEEEGLKEGEVEE